MENNWQNVFNRLPIERQDKSLAEISGFDKFTTDYSTYKRFILEKLLMRIQEIKAVKVCEVGCGCGDKLKFFYEKGFQCYGADYAENMIIRAKKEMPNGEFHVAQASVLPFTDASMDVVFSNGVFQYFSNQEYAKGVLNEMKRVLRPEGGIFVWEIPDIQSKEIVLKHRGVHEPGYEHFYYDINFFVQYFSQYTTKHIAIDFWERPEYFHSKYRFNCSVLF